MKILKSNTNQVFDTDDINFLDSYTVQNQELTDYEFLQKYFPLEHSIFHNFSNSFINILF
jgi:hypothetical protein